MAHAGPFLVQTWPQNSNSERVYQIFFGTTGSQHKLIILIEPLTYFIENQQEKESGCDLGAKFGPN